MRGSKLYRTVPIQCTYGYTNITTRGNSVKRGESPSVNLLEALEVLHECDRHIILAFPIGHSQLLFRQETRVGLIGILPRSHQLSEMLCCIFESNLHGTSKETQDSLQDPTTRVQGGVELLVWDKAATVSWQEQISSIKDVTRILQRVHRTVCCTLKQYATDLRPESVC